jgi:hypothetical protein
METINKEEIIKQLHAYVDQLEYYTGGVKCVDSDSTASEIEAIHQYLNDPRQYKRIYRELRYLSMSLAQIGNSDCHSVEIILDEIYKLLKLLTDSQ